MNKYRHSGQKSRLRVSWQQRTFIGKTVDSSTFIYLIKKKSTTLCTCSLRLTLTNLHIVIRYSLSSGYLNVKQISTAKIQANEHNNLSRGVIDHTRLLNAVF